MLEKKILSLREGYSEVWIEDAKYGVSKKTFTGGRSIKVFAEELRGNNLISFNYYYTNKGNLLKPCEMPSSKVIHFLESYRYL